MVTINFDHAIETAQSRQKSRKGYAWVVLHDYIDEAGPRSVAAYNDMLKLALGARPRPRSDDAQRERDRIDGMRTAIQWLTQRIYETAPSVPSRGSKQLLVNVLRRARARLKAKRLKLPAAPRFLAACAAATADLGSEIKRHGPPRLLAMPPPAAEREQMTP